MSNAEMFMALIHSKQNDGRKKRIKIVGIKETNHTKNRAKM